MSARVIVEFTECGDAVKIGRWVEADDGSTARENLGADTVLELVGVILDEAEAATFPMAAKEGGAE